MSTTVAPALMLVVSVSVLSGVAMTTMESVDHDNEVNTAVEIAKDTSNFVLRHNGGDAVPAEAATLAVYFSDDTYRVYPLSNFPVELGDGFWSIGDRIPIPEALPPLGDLTVKGLRISYVDVDIPETVTEAGETVGQLIEDEHTFLACRDAGSPDQVQVELTAAQWSQERFDGTIAGICPALCAAYTDGHESDSHGKGQGKGHDEHGQGHGYGHDKHHDGECSAICHKPGTPAQMTKYVPPSAVAAHLRHGDSEGPCDGDDAKGKGKADDSKDEDGGEGE